MNAIDMFFVSDVPDQLTPAAESRHCPRDSACRRWLLAVALAATAALPSGAEVKSGSFPSAALGREVGYAVELPASYATGARRYPVVYALHGLFESSSFWESRGLAPIFREATSKGELPELIVVAVDGTNSFFLNSPNGRFEDLVTQDLIAHVDATYRTVAGRGGRGLLGISMGGYAALRIAMTKPELFAAVAAHSAMLLVKIPTAEDGARRGQMAAFNRVFGSPIDPVLWAASDPLALAERANAKQAPALYFDCGSEDRFGLFEGNKELHTRLEARKVAHEFGLHAGDHGYEYVRSVLPRSLRFLGKALAGVPAAAGANTR